MTLRVLKAMRIVQYVAMIGLVAIITPILTGCSATERTKETTIGPSSDKEWASFMAEQDLVFTHPLKPLSGESLFIADWLTSRIVVQTTMPLGAGHERKSALISFGNLLQETNQRKNELLDTYCYMANQNGDLPEAFTDDQVHLTEEGYFHWST